MNDIEIIDVLSGNIIITNDGAYFVMVQGDDVIVLNDDDIPELVGSTGEVPGKFCPIGLYTMGFNDILWNKQT